MKTNLSRLIGAVLVVLSLAIPTSGQSLQKIIVSGDTNPDGDGTFGYTVDFPAINNRGDIAFTGLTSGTSSQRVFIGAEDSLIQVIGQGDPAPDENGYFDEFEQATINNAGQVAFACRLNGTLGPWDTEGIYLSDGSTLAQIARMGEPAPGAAGGAFFSFVYETTLALNDQGQVAFNATINLDNGGSLNDGMGIFRGDEQTVTKIARNGETPPEGDGSFLSFGPPSINGAGETFFWASLNRTLGESSGIYRGDGVTDGVTLTKIVRDGDATPNSDGTFSTGFTSSGHNVNDLGQVAFHSLVTANQSGEDYLGLFLGDGSTTYGIVRTGEEAPDGNGTFIDLQGGSLNNLGQVAFRGVLTETTGSNNDNTGIFVGDGSTLTQIAREDELVPNNDGRFGLLFFPAVNDVGQVAFASYLNQTSDGENNNFALFIYDGQLGMTELIRKGDPFLGSTIDQFYFAHGSSRAGDKWMGFNESGQAAVSFILADGRRGIALIRFVTIIRPDTFNVTRGLLASGDVSDLSNSDDRDLVVRRNSSDVQSRIVLNIKATSPTASPTQLTATLEGSVFARSLVNQSLDLFNYHTAQYEQIGMQPASPLLDQVMSVEATGDLARFVEADTCCIEMRVRFESPSARQQFSANVDQTVLTIK